MEARRPDELFMPIPRHLVPLPTRRRALAQLRARVNHFYVLSRLETPSAGPPPGWTGRQARQARAASGAITHPGPTARSPRAPGGEKRIK
jgi:hypothetical protein